MWRTVKLGDVVSYTKSNAEGSRLPYVGMENIASETLELIGDINVPESTSTTFEFNESHVLFGRLRPYLRKVLVPSFRGQCSTEIFCLKPSCELLREYLAYWLLEPTVSKQIVSTSTGARMPRANMNKLLEFEFVLPPLAEQQRIVAKLDAAFAEIDRATEATITSIEQAQIGLSNLIDNKTSTRSDWREFKVSDLGKVQTGNTPKTSEKINYGNDIPFVKPPHFRTDGTIEIVKDGLSLIGAKLSRKAAPNSIMMVCIGATIGKVAVCHEEVCFNQQINSLSPAKDYDAELIYWQMRGNRFQKDVRERAGQATLPIISKAKWANLSIHLPSSVDVQVQIRNQLRGLSDLTEKYCSIKSTKIDALHKLKSAVLAQELQPSEAA